MRIWRKETLRKTMSMLLCLVMVLGLLPVPVLAEETGCTVADCTGTYVEGVCNVCGSSETPAVPEEKQVCSHSGGTANCVAQAICETCNEPYGELSGHTGGEATCKAQAVCTVCTTAYGELAAHTGGTATCTAQAVCEVCGTGYGELLPHSYGVDGLCACGAVCGHNYAEGVCTICGAECEHNFAEGVCTVCGMGEPSCICEVACGGENGIRYDCPACVLDFGRCAHFVVSCTCVEKCTEEARNLWCPVCGTRGVEECEGEDQCVVYAHKCNDINFTTELNSAQASLSGDYYLNNDFYNNYTNLSVSTGQTANLCLQGHTLTVTYLNIHGTLNLYDCKGSGEIAIRLVGDVCVFGNGTLNIFGGTVQNLKNLDGAAVRNITYNVKGSGSITRTVNSGNVTLTAKPAEGYKFVKWESIGTQGQTSGNQYIMTASGTYNVTAVFEVAHTHSYVYSVSADGATITATCANTDNSCTNPNGGSVTIYAPTRTVYGGTGDIAATLSAASISGVTTLPAIQYQKQENDVWGTDTTIAPTDAGRYKASLTVVTGKTISVEYTIAQKSLNDVTLTLSPETFVYDGSEKEVTSITAWFGEVTLTRDTDYTVDDSSVTRATDVSTGNGYAVTITAVANGNYTGSQTTYWTITKTANSWATAPEESYSWVYGSPATPTADARFGDVKVEYRLANADNGDEAYTETVPANVGSYLVRFSVAGTADYEALSEVKNLTIIKADLTITAGSQTITYGDAAPIYSVTGSGFQNNDNLASLDAANASVTCSYKKYDDADDYDIIPSGYASNNYEITYVKGTLTVEQKEIGIQWSTEPIIFKENTEQAPTATATGLVTNGEGVTDTCTITVTGAQINAGAYTATAESLSNPNYKLPGDVTTEFTIQNAAQAKPDGVVGVAETIREKGDGEITGVDSTMEYRAEGETAYTAIAGHKVTNLAAGTYYVRKAAKTNYNASEDAEVTVSEGPMLRIYLPAEQIGYTIITNLDKVAYGGTVTLTYRLAAGYTEGTAFAVAATNGTVTDNGDGTYTVSDITEDTTVSVTGVSDVTAPSAEITVATNQWTEFLNAITFDLFFKQTQTVTITAEDTGSGLASVEYYLNNSAMTLDQVKAISSWSGYNGSFSIDAENQYVIYAKVTDRDQNILYISSDGIVLDKTQPVISGVTNGATYYTTQKITATDNTVLDTLTGTNADNTIPGDPAQETKHNIVATDKAGNTTTFEITMKPISSLAAGLPTEDTVELTDKDAIEAIKKNVSDVLANQSAHATDAEKTKLAAIIQECNDLLDQIRKAEAVIALIQALPDASGVEPDNKTAIDAYDTALAAYNDPNLPASSKRMVGEENKVRLDAVGKALTAYDIIKQSSNSYVKGSGKILSFTANGYYAEYGSYAANAYGKFVGVEVDGKVVDAKNYTAKAGSTVITLKSSYLDSLSTGKHTIKINYIDGSTDGEDTFRISINNGNPFTGDHTHIMLFSGVALTSLLCMAMMIVFFPRKKGKYQR